MENDALLKPPEYKRNALGQFDRPGKTMSNAQKPNKQMGEITETQAVEIKRSPGRPKGSQNKVNVALKEAILAAGEAAGGEEGLVGYLTRLAVENSSAYAGLLGKILPSVLRADESDGGPVTEIRFVRQIVYPDGRIEDSSTPKQIEHKASHMLPSQDDPTDDTNDIK